MWIHHSLTFIVICTIVLGEEAAREAESLVTAALKSEKFRDTSKNVTKEIDTTERGRRKSKEETRQEISDAIAQSSRLLVALKTEVDMNIKTKDLANHSSFVMFLRKGLSKILGFKISLLKFLAMGTDKVDEQKLSNSIKIHTTSRHRPNIDWEYNYILIHAVDDLERTSKLICRHLGVHDESIRCEYCRQEFELVNQLREHMAQIHHTTLD